MARQPLVTGIRGRSNYYGLSQPSSLCRKQKRRRASITISAIVTGSIIVFFAAYGFLAFIVDRSRP